MCSLSESNEIVHGLNSSLAQTPAINSMVDKSTVEWSQKSSESKDTAAPGDEWSPTSEWYCNISNFYIFYMPLSLYSYTQILLYALYMKNKYYLLYQRIRQIDIINYWPLIFRVESWKSKLPLQTIMRVLQILVPQVEKICIDK